MTKRPKTHAEAVNDSRKKRGAVQTNLTLSADEAALLDRLAKEYGGKKTALVAGLYALNKTGNAVISVDEVIAQIRKRMK